MAKSKIKVPNVFTYGTGKRKSSIAKVWLFEGSGEIIVNDLVCADYFGCDLDSKETSRPLELVGLQSKYSVKASVLGGGKAGQVDAIILGISRALLELNPAFREKLKAEGFLTRDPRVKERKKYGLRGARKAPQYRKR